MVLGGFLCLWGGVLGWGGGWQRISLDTPPFEGCPDDGSEGYAALACKLGNLGMEVARKAGGGLGCAASEFGLFAPADLQRALYCGQACIKLGIYALRAHGGEIARGWPCPSRAGVNRLLTLIGEKACAGLPCSVNRTERYGRLAGQGRSYSDDQPS